MPRHFKKPRTARKRKINHPYGLCVIDMQPSFSTSQDPATMQACLDLISKAIEDGAYIIVAQYTGYGKTDKRITDLVSNYRHAGYCWANQDNKAESIMRLLQRNNAQTTDYHVCGVNLEACVYSTVYHLKHAYRKKIVLREDACNSACDGMYYADTLHRMRRDGIEIKSR